MTDTTPGTGRTPWDFLSDVLGLLYRIGPTTVVVAGFLIFALLFYQELTRARSQTDEQLQKRLSTAQGQLIETYEKIGSMSDQMLGNIRNLIQLNNTIDREIENSRKDLKKLEEEAKFDLEEAQAQARDARADAAAAKKEAVTAKRTADTAAREVQLAKQALEDAKQDAENAKSEVTKAKNAVSQAKNEAKIATAQADTAREEIRSLQEAEKLADKEATEAKSRANSTIASMRDTENKLFSLDTKRKELEVKIAELTRERKRRETEIAARARHIASQQDMIQDLQRKLEETGPNTIDVPQDREHQLMVDLLEQFAASPGESTSKLQRDLIGLIMSTFTRVIGQAEGFESWISAQDGAHYGFVKSTEYGYGSFLQVSAFGSDSIAAARPFFGVYAFNIPRSDDWYNYWTVWTVVTEDDLITRYDAGDYSRWDIYSAFDKWDMELNLEEGKSSTFDIILIEEFENLHPKTFQVWAKSVDEFGRPSLNLRMLEHANGFDASSISWIKEGKLPGDLVRTFKEILVACVMRKTGEVSKNIGPAIHNRELGTLAAMALRDDPKVVEGISGGVGGTDAQGDENFRITVSVAGLEKNEDEGSTEILGDRYDIRFVRRAEGGPWQLVDVARRSI